MEFDGKIERNLKKHKIPSKIKLIKAMQSPFCNEINISKLFVFYFTKATNVTKNEKKVQLQLNFVIYFYI